MVPTVPEVSTASTSTFELFPPHIQRHSTVCERKCSKATKRVCVGIGLMFAIYLLVIILKKNIYQDMPAQNLNGTKAGNITLDFPNLNNLSDIKNSTALPGVTPFQIRDVFDNTTGYGNITLPNNQTDWALNE